MSNENDPFNNPAFHLPADYRDLRGSDAWQALMLGPRRGDLGVFRNYNSNARWGATAKLTPINTPSFVGVPNPTNRATLVDTDDFPRNIPIAYQLRFSLSPSGPFSAVFPSAADSGATIELIKSVDMKAGPAVEAFTLFPGSQQPTCTIITRKLSIIVTNLSEVGFDPGDSVTLYVQAAACPVEWIDCRDITGNGTTYPVATETTVPASTTPVTLLAANANRAQLFVQNTSTNADMIIKLGTAPSFSPLSGSFILKAGTFGIFESQLNGYTGIVTAVWSGSSPNGAALVTEGTS